MLIPYDPDGRVPFSEHTRCSFHEKHPGESYAGCTCSGTIGYRNATPEERAANRQKRLERERIRLAEALAQIDRELNR